MGGVRVLPQKYWISKLPLVSPSLLWLPHHMGAPFSAAGESAGCWAEPTNDARILSASPCEISLSKVSESLLCPAAVSRSTTTLLTVDSGVVSACAGDTVAALSAAATILIAIYLVAVFMDSCM